MRHLILSVIFLSNIALLVLPLSALAEGKNEDINAIIKKIDELYRASSSYAEMEMTITTPDWERTLKLEAWSEGMKKTFIVIQEPKKDQGIATLRMDKEMWNFFPKINKVMKVPPSMMMGSWMGSDFTNDDLVKESTLLDDYDAKLIKPQDAKEEFYYIELKPKQQTASVWGKIIITANKSDYLPVSQDYYDEKGNKMRVMTFDDVQDFSGRKIPSKMTIAPVNKENHKTVIKYLKAEFDKKLDEDVFTLRNLQKKR